MDDSHHAANLKLYHLLDSVWSPHSIDHCFASSRTRQMSRFCSRWWNPGCSGIDAFAMIWSGERVWLVPPMYLIRRLVDMEILSKCHRTALYSEKYCAALVISVAIGTTVAKVTRSGPK